MIRPAFTSNARAVAFALLIIFCLVSPLLQAIHPPAREQIYKAVATTSGPLSFFSRQAFVERGDIDILFLGSSISWAGIDAAYMQSALSGHLARPATVLSVGSNWRGEDLLYYQLRDLLERRHVNLLVFSPPVLEDREDAPHSQAFRWADLRATPAAPPLTLRQRAAEFGLLVLGSPRRWLMYLRDELGTPPDAVDASLGAYRARLGYRPVGAPREPFVAFDPPPPAFDGASLLFGPATAGHFRFSNESLTTYQAHYLALINELAEQHHVKIAVLHIPRHTEALDSTIGERTDWRNVFGANVPMVGVVPQRLFAGLDAPAIRQLYYDDHFNENGNGYFSRAIAPGLLRAYDEQILHKR